jgi:hypothetical protein
LTTYTNEVRRSLMRARNLGVVTIVMAVALLLPVGHGGIFGGGEALAKSDATVHYKCYKIVPSGLPLPPHIVDLLDQFGPQENVVVTASELLCAPALKNGEGVPIAEFPHLKCYVISRDAPPLRQTVLLEDQFGEEEVQVMEPQLLCQQVEKQVEKSLPKAR